MSATLWILLFLAGLGFEVLLPTGFGLACGSAALPAAIAAWAGLSANWQWGLFAACALVSLPVCRLFFPKLFGRRRSGKPDPAADGMPCDQLVGTAGSVSETIPSAGHGEGQIACAGSFWRAVTTLDEELPPDTPIIVSARQEGDPALLIVRKTTAPRPEPQA